MGRTVAGLVALVLLGSLAGCGSEQPVGSDPGLPRAGGDQRLLALYRHDEQRVSATVRIPDGTTRLRIRGDCIVDDGSTLGRVTIGDVGEGSIGCATTSQPSGYIGLSGKDFGRYGEQTVTVRVPEGATWSVAIDAG